MIELAKRAVACKHWRWMSGMLPVNNTRVCFCVADETDIPDLTDPATLGCLLALVREATGLPVFAGQLISGLWVVRYVSNGLDDGFVNGKWGDTEAEALVAALEAAP